MPQALAKLAAATTPAAADDPADLTAVELLDAYAAKRLSPVEAMRAVLARVERREPQLKALYALDPDGALRGRGGIGGALGERRGAAARRRPGHDQGEHRDAEARRCRSAPRRGRSSRRRRTRRRRRGCARRARSSSPRRRCRITACCRPGLSSFHPLARNPWDLASNPGGSSAGAGAAAAAGYGPLHRRHRHRRLDPPAGRLVRHLRPEAEPRPRADRSALLRAASPGR